MLNAMREGAKSGFMKFFLFSFMVLAVGGLVLMDVGGFFRGGVTRTAVAKIDGVELPITTFDRMLRRVLGNQGLDIETAYRLGLIDQVLASEINSNLIQRKAKDMGLQASDETVLIQLNKLIEPFVSEEIDRKTAFNNILRSQGMSEADFVRMMKAQMTNTMLQNTIQIGSEIPVRGEGEDLYQYQNEQRTIKAIYLPHSEITDIVEPAEEILLPFYQAGQERYAIPETRTFTVAILDQEQLKKSMDISEEELKAVYERDIDTFTVAEQRVLEQAVIDNEAMATAIADRVKKGESFKQAVKAETESTNAYLGEEAFEQAGLLEELSGPVFEANKGDVVGPLESALGWHVFKVKEIAEPKTKSFADVKEQLRKELVSIRLMDEMFAMANSIDDHLAGGMPLEEVAETMGMTIKTYGPVREDGSTPDSKDGVSDFGGDSGFITETVFSLHEGEVSPVTELSGGRYAAMRVDSITEKTYKPFEEVKDDLRKVWIDDQKQVANKLRTEEALRRLNNGEADLKTIAAETKAQIKTYKLERTKDAPEKFGDAAKNLFFYIEKDGHGASPATDGYVIGKVESVTLPDTEKLSGDELERTMQLAENGNQEEALSLFLQELHNEYDVKINKALIDRTYGPGGELQ
ncbi:MAG: peptidyl-prolyl cis-trans isomerase [Rhodospirillales bacterium]|nr:peptidyl-prolyl cis-trans isomerase [Rhodospirillales bacterium]MCB9995637.1 peptidyl-prolyl cis-trans isomerase [Rhodospirillales bacterium]